MDGHQLTILLRLRFCDKVLGTRNLLIYHTHPVFEPSLTASQSQVAPLQGTLSSTPLSFSGGSQRKLKVCDASFFLLVSFPRNGKVERADVIFNI